MNVRKAIRRAGFHVCPTDFMKICALTTLFCTSCESPSTIKKKQYFGNGLVLYQQYCANCHQMDGSGLRALIPPLKNSDYLRNKAQVACAIKYGLRGAIVVNGKTYNQPMPANEKLTDVEISYILTYVYNTWGGQDTITTVHEVRQALQTCNP